jgi:hypothetical protein
VRFLLPLLNAGVTSVDVQEAVTHDWETWRRHVRNPQPQFAALMLSAAAAERRPAPSRHNVENMFFCVAIS